MFRKTVAHALVIALVLVGSPSFASVAQGAPLSGVVLDASQKPVANACVRLVNSDTGEQVATTRTDGQGKYQFPAVKPGNYFVEVRDANCDKVIGTSAPLVVAAAAMTDIAVVVGEAAAAGGFFTSTAAVLLLAGATAGVVALVALRNEASPGSK